MWKKIGKAVVGVLIAAYVVLSMTAADRVPDERVCTGLTVVVKDSTATSFVSRREMDDLLSRAGLRYMDQPMADIRTEPIEEALQRHPLIERVECYKTPEGRLCVELYQRIPILRVMAQGGDEYYVDNRGGTMPVDPRCLSHLPIATGRIEKTFACDKLYKIALFLQGNAFWRSQVEQINVVAGGNVEIVPRVGNHIIYLGQPDDVERKLARVRRFYDKGLSQVGWNRYSRINVEFANQIICTRRE